jgi:hypothetical protein
MGMKRIGITGQDDIRVLRTERSATETGNHADTETTAMIERGDGTEIDGEKKEMMRIVAMTEIGEEMTIESTEGIGTTMTTRGINDAEKKTMTEDQDDVVEVNRQDVVRIKAEHYLMQYAIRTKTVLIILNLSNAVPDLPNIKVHTPCHH